MVFTDSLTKAQKLIELELVFWNDPALVLSSTKMAGRSGVAARHR